MVLHIKLIDFGNYFFLEAIFRLSGHRYCWPFCFDFQPHCTILICLFCHIGQILVSYYLPASLSMGFHYCVLLNIPTILKSHSQMKIIWEWDFKKTGFTWRDIWKHMIMKTHKESYWWFAPSIQYQSKLLQQSSTIPLHKISCGDKNPVYCYIKAWSPVTFSTVVWSTGMCPKYSTRPLFPLVWSVAIILTGTVYKRIIWWEYMW